MGICATGLILASETKFVLKDEVSGAGSEPDIYIFIEVAVYAAVAGYLLLRRDGFPSLAGAHPLEVGLIGYVALMALTVPLAPSPVYAAVRVMEMTVLLFLIRVAVAQAPTGWFLSFVKAFLVATAGLVLIGLTVPGQRGPLQQDRFNWLATHSVVVGEFLALAAVASLVMAVGLQWQIRVVRLPVAYWGGFTLFSAALVANNTRGSAAAAAVGVAVGLVLILPRRLWVSALLLMVYAGLLVALVGSELLLSWITRGEDSERLGSLNARLPLWRLALTSVAETNPVFGFGVGASRSIFVDETGLGGAHNAAINVLVDLGIAGLAIWTAVIIYSTLIVSRRKPTSARQLLERALWLSSMVVLLANGATAEGIGGVANVGMGWLFVLAARAAQLSRDSRPVTSPKPPDAPDQDILGGDSGSTPQVTNDEYGNRRAGRGLNGAKMEESDS